MILLALFSLASACLPLKEFSPAGHGAHGPLFVTLLGLVVGTSGFLGALYLYAARPKALERLSGIFRAPREVLLRKYFVDDFYNALIRYGQDALARACDLFEQYFIVNFCVNGTARLARFAGDSVRRIQTGRIQFYALILSLGVTLLAYGLLLWKR